MSRPRDGRPSRQPVARERATPLARETNTHLLAATKELIEAMTREPGAFDFAAYRDTYTDKLRAVIDAKMAG